MADKIIENLITRLTFEYDEKAIDNFNKSLNTAVKTLTGVVTASAAAAAGIFGFTKSIAETNDELGKLSQRLGVDVTDLQELGYVAELNGSSINTMNSSMENLSRIASEASIGMGAGVEAFGRLGISVTDAEGRVKSADDLFVELADNISGLGTQAEKLELSQKLGIDAGLLLTLDQGTDALLRQKKEAQELGFAFGKDGAKAAAAFNDSLLRLRKIVTGVSNIIGTKLMKQIQPVIEAFSNWFKANRALIQQRLEDVLTRLISIIQGVFNISIRVFGVINNIVQAFGGWENAIKLVAGAFIALNASALILPIILTAIAAAILLLIEDFQKFYAGGDSAIGNLLEKFPTLGAAILSVADIVKMVAEGWKLIFTQGGEAIEGLQMMISDFTSFLGVLVDQMIVVGKTIMDFIILPINKTIDLLNKIPGVNIPDIPSLSGQFTAGSTVPTASPGNSNVANTTTNNIKNSSKPNINIRIDGGNPTEVKRVVKEALDEQYAGAVTNLSSEVEF